MNFITHYLLACETRHYNRAHKAYLSAQRDARYFLEQREISRTKIEQHNRKLQRAEWRAEVLV